MVCEVIPAAMDTIKCLGVINGLTSCKTVSTSGGFTASITISECLTTSSLQ